MAAFFLIATIALPGPASAQSAQTTRTGDVEGVVYNLTNALPVGRAKVIVKGTDESVLTDDQGRFRFADVPVGTVELEVTYLGFDPQTVTVSVEPGETAVRDFQLVREGSAMSKARQEDGTVYLEAFEVVADSVMTAQAIAMNEQRHAASIKHVVALEDLGDYGTENIGDYIRFMPGVAIIDDDEDAGRLALGGFPAEMTNVQLDGGEVASTGVGTESGRTLGLQEIPMMNVERVEITKVPTPDMPASGLGGSMNLVTKSLLGTRRPYLNYSAYMNFNDQEGLSFDGGGKQPIPQVSPSTKKPSFNTSVVVPMGKRFAMSAGLSRSWRQRPADDTPTEIALWNLNPVDYRDGSEKDFALATAQWSQIAQLSVTESLQLGAEWRMSANDTLSFNIQSRQVTTDRATSRLSTRFHYGLQYDPIDPVGDGSETSTKPGLTNVGGTLEMGGNTSLNYSEVTDNNHMTLRYKHRSDDWHIDAQAVSSIAERVRSSIGEGYFSGYYALANEKAGTTSGRGYDIVGRGINEGPSILPSSYTVTNSVTGEVVDPFDGSHYGLQSVREEDGVYKTDMFSGRADVTRMFGNTFAVKVGASFNRMEKDDYQVPIPYTFVGDERFGDRSVDGMFERRKMSHYDVFDEDIAVTMNGNPVRWISPVKLYNLFLEHPEYFELNDSATQYRAERSKRMIEDIAAAYLRFDLRLLDQRMQVTGGVRYEKTALDGWSVKTDQMAIYERDPDTGMPLKNPNGTWRYITTDPLEQIKLIYQERAFHEGQEYDGFYPSLNVNYAFTDNLVLRGAYARTIGRPDVRYVVAGITVPDALETGDAPVEDPETGADLTRTISVGNPGLEPWTADSFHLSLDSYHLKGGFGSIGVYRKNVSNFFERRTPLATREELEYYGLTEADIETILAEGFAFRRWENIGDANLTGLELSYRQDLFFLPDWLQKMQVWVNYTHLEVGGPNAVDFTGFSPDAYSWGINYIRPRFSLRLTCAHQAETKRASATPAPGTQASRHIPLDTYDYQSASTRYGITAEYTMSRAFALYLTWNNVFNEDSYIYRRAPDTPEYAQNYRRLVNPSYIMIGVKGRF